MKLFVRCAAAKGKLERATAFQWEIEVMKASSAKVRSHRPMGPSSDPSDAQSSKNKKRNKYDAPVHPNPELGWSMPSKDPFRGWP